MIRNLALFVSACLLCAPAVAQESSVKREITRASLLTVQDALAPGKPLQVGLLLEARAGWHTYWENPGDAGMATSMAWTLPEGFTAGPIQWPVPQRLTEGPLLTYSYAKPVLLPVTLIPPATLSAPTYTVTLHAEWLACKDICIPESADLSIMLPVSKQPAPSAQAELFAQVQPPEKISGLYQADGKHITLSLPIKTATSVAFMPRQLDLIHYAAPQEATSQGGTLRVMLEAADTKPKGDIGGFLAVTGKDGKHTDYEVTLSPGSVAAASQGSFFAALLFALLGGLVLNLMPCVLPVLSLKALAIAKKSGKERAVVVRLGVAYTFGVMLSFALVAGLLIGLRMSGEAVGWGYQMQSPAFVGFLAYLLFAVGLNLSGLFELPVLLGNVGGELANESSARGSFFTGVLATAVATPCTAPFMASAVGIALTLPPIEALLIFEALGFGLALPFLLVSLFPRCLRFLPKPGAWMETFRHFLAFPMYASVIWLLWVLTLQTGVGGTTVALGSMLAMAFVLWTTSLHPKKHLVAPLLCALILIGSLPILSRMEIATSAMPGGDMHGTEMMDYSPQKLAELRARNIPVYVDATAAWCITCQLNARIALHTDRTMEAFKRNGVVLMIADWTRRNDDITALLSDFGFKGVPLNVFYPAHGDPVVLPQLLTSDIVISTIERK